MALNNLANLLQNTNRSAEAEALYRRALAIDEKSFGPELATLLQGTKRLHEAEPLMRRAIVIFEKSYGPEHPNIAAVLNYLAELRAEVGDWSEAAALGRRAMPIMIRAQGQEGANAARSRNTWVFRAVTRAIYRAQGDKAREESFALAQWALQTSAADALTQMSVRFAKGAGPLAQSVRDRQDLIARRHGEDKRLLAAIGAADTTAAEAIRAGISRLDSKLDVIDRQLANEFPQYAELANPKPLTIAATQALLKNDEALLVLLDVHSGEFNKLAWAVTKTESRSISIPLGTVALAGKVATLRCGLDREGLWSWSGRSQRWLAKSEHCRALKPDGLDADELLPFDVGVAHELYRSLLAPFADLIKDKSLIVVPSGPLTSLPFHVLLTAMPSPPYREISWLALKQPLSILPSVGSLQSLRRLPPSEANEPYIAFGNPLLGAANDEQTKRASAKQKCPQILSSLQQRTVAAAKDIPAFSKVFRGGSVDLDVLRAQTPLPETADELCAVAKALGALGRERDTVWLGARATETNLKALSRERKLARYRVLHFATHGLLAGESEAILKAKAEPGLVLSPPKAGINASDLEHDDGLLTASEVAGLELDADWAVLSACNTAAGDKGDAEALSGLARAFFYAKARALLVSHWAVDSDATVELITKTFAAMRADPRIGRAEALRRSMVALISKGDTYAHPAIWAPFVVVGEGQTNISAPAAATKPKTAPTAKTPPQPDWRTEVLAR